MKHLYSPLQFEQQQQQPQPKAVNTKNLLYNLHNQQNQRISMKKQHQQFLKKPCLTRDNLHNNSNSNIRLKHEEFLKRHHSPKLKSLENIHSNLINNNCI